MTAQAVKTVAPRSPAEAGELLRGCAEDGVAVRLRGASTKPWGAPGADCGVELTSARLGEVVEYNAGDLTAVVQPGAPLRELQELFAARGQMLALDPPLGAGEAATIGGAVAAADSGPLRHRHGAARDLVLGVTIALPDGTLAQAGGKVIKNVAGYDLAKLYTGSFGTLGFITQIAVRLHPRPAGHATATATTDDPGLLQRAAIALARSSLEAQALDVRWEAGSGAVLARFAGRSPSAQADAAQRLLDGVDDRLEVATREDDDELWDDQRAGQRCAEGGAVVRVSGRPTGLADACVAAQVAGATLVGRAALGIWWIALPASAPGELVTAIARLRKVLAPSHCVVADAPAYVRAHLDPWDHPEDTSLVLMRRVKERFDPTRTCNPGIFVGGI